MAMLAPTFLRREGFVPRRRKHVARRRSMNKRNWILAAAIAVALSGGVALAADLSNGSGQSCDGVGAWHFVNNQTGGAAAGVLTATIGGVTYTVGASAVNNNTQHFNITASGTLQSASTNLPGRLVLSDLSCDEDDKEPPPCDPKKEICK
jgi:hypothetical protein